MLRHNKKKERKIIKIKTMGKIEAKTQKDGEKKEPKPHSSSTK